MSGSISGQNDGWDLLAAYQSSSPSSTVGTLGSDGQAASGDVSNTGSVSSFDSMMFMLMMSQSGQAGSAQSGAAQPCDTAPADIGTSGTSQAATDPASQLMTDLDALLATLSGLGTSASSASGDAASLTDPGATLAGELQAVANDLTAAGTTDASGASSGTDASVSSSDSAWAMGLDGSIDISQGGGLVAGGMPPFLFGLDGWSTSAAAEPASSDAAAATASPDSAAASSWPPLGFWQAIADGGSTGTSGQASYGGVNQQFSDAISAYASSSVYSMDQGMMGSLQLTA